MSDELEERGCEQYADELAELALGVLTGRERAQVLAHVDSCPRCAEDLEILSRTADSVLQAAPDMEPPLGFEVRTLERMGVTEGRPRRRHIRPSRWIPVVVGVAAAAAAVGVGVDMATSPSSPAPQANAPAPRSDQTPTAALVSDGRTVGHVMLWSDAKPWISMMMDDSGAHGTVRCVVVTKDGVSHDVGAFTSRDGYAAWTAALPVPPSSVRTAKVVGPSGTVIATATLG